MAVDDGSVVASLAANGVCALVGNCRITGSNVDAWGLGVVQTIDAAEAQMYIVYRNYSADFDLAATGSANVAAESTESFQTVMTGAIISF